jgi:hypothetical protein
VDDGGATLGGVQRAVAQPLAADQPCAEFLHTPERFTPNAVDHGRPKWGRKLRSATTPARGTGRPAGRWRASDQVSPSIAPRSQRTGQAISNTGKSAVALVVVQALLPVSGHSGADQTRPRVPARTRTAPGTAHG